MNFSIEKKGYSINEVDAFVEDITAKYQRLQAQNAELEQKLATAKRLIRRFSDTENALKQNIADSKRAAAYMISDAKERSDELLDSARESCGDIISDLDMNINERMVTVDRLRAEVIAFKEEIFGLYSSHIELIDKLALTAETFEYSPDYTPIAEAVDKFEEKETPVFEAPDFVDYPEESIFAELAEDEPKDDEEFVISAPAADVSEAESEAEIEFVTEGTLTDEPLEEDDDEQITLDEEEFANAVEFDFDNFHIEGVDDAEDIKESEPFEEELILEEETESFSEEISFEEVEESESEEETKKEERDYFKFLSDFANSEDSEE